MPEAQTILTPEQQTKMGAFFDGLVTRAENPPPQLNDFNDPKEYSAAKTAYENNPVLAYVQVARQERDALIQSGQSPEKAGALYDYKIGELKNAFTSGADRGAPDPEAAQKQQGVMDALMNGNWMEAIKMFLLSIPFIGDFLGAGGKWLKSKFPGGDDLDFSTARSRITLEKSFDGAGMNMGLDPRQTAQLRAQGIAALEDPDFVPEARKESAAPTPAGNPPVLSTVSEPSLPPVDESFEAFNGQFVGPPSPIPATGSSPQVSQGSPRK